MVIVGKNEMENNSVTVRVRDGGELKDVKVEDFINRVKEDNTLRR
jgi:threonyl-tRNA synthetase